ncbi:MAG: bifunctional metallophosphatase/5'-nucleotidase [Syntrophales bacterium]
MSFPLKAVRMFLVAVGIVVLAACGGGQDPQPLSLAIAHVNDTHSHLEPSDNEWETFVIDGVNTSVKVGGVTRLKTALDELRSSRANVLFLHAGDAVQGTLYFNVFQGDADFDFLNELGVEAMTFGNHEFDKGAAFAGRFVAKAAFPILSANIDVSQEPALAGKVAPYLIKTYGSERVGIIGVTTQDTAVTSSPGDTVKFNDVTTSVADAVRALEAQGINKIVVLSHIGYDEDVKLAGAVAGIDVVVGGHSHTLLGDPAQFAALGITPSEERLKGPYPTAVTSPGEGTALVVQGWRWTEALASLDVEFDAAGRIVSYGGRTQLLPQNVFKQNGVQLQPGSAAYLNVVAKINATAIARLYDEDPATADRLRPYAEKLAEYRSTVVATATENLTRGQNSGPGPLFSDAMIWKTKAQIALEQRGGVKTDLAAGSITVGNVMGVLPYGGTVVFMDLTGQQLKDALEDGCDFQISQGWDWFPHVAGMTYAVVNSRAVPKGQRIRSLRVRSGDGSFAEMDMAATYRLATNDFLAKGGDGFTALKNIPRTDTGLIDADVFADYLRFLSQVSDPKDQRVIVLSAIAGIERRPVVQLARYRNLRFAFFRKAA